MNLGVFCTIFNLQSATWKSPSLPRKKKPQWDRSKSKAMLELLFDSTGIVHMEFIPEGATVNKHSYKEILCRPCNSLRHKCLQFWRRKNWLLLHNITLCLSKRSCQNNRTLFCHSLHIHITLRNAISFSFPA
jgi:hypothetical protein